MAWKNLQLCILEDVAETCRPAQDFEEHFPVYSIYAKDAIVDRKRPEGLLQLVADVASPNITSAEICDRLGMPPNQGMLTSVGRALGKLGWTRRRTQKTTMGGALWVWSK